MQKSPAFYVALGFILAFFIIGIIVMLVPELRPYAVYKGAGAESHCSDGIDNDGNGLVDMDDPGCQGGAGAEPTTTGEEPTPDGEPTPAP